MNRQLALLLTAIFIIGLAACAPGAVSEAETIVETVVVQEAMEDEAAEMLATGAPQKTVADSADFGSNPIGQSGLQSQSQRMIIKDAVMSLLVADTDIAIERLTQVIGDMNGYTISTRIWYEDFLDKPYKYATFTIGVPVDNFEPALQRIRGLAVRVLDESASGEDVTDQFVDLQSRLENLRATRDRIRDFLEAATTVEEALQVNEQLSEVEAEIEAIQGRMNYLSDRAAYSTITLTFEPELPDVPTPTPSPTPTPTPTPTPVPWTASETFRSATRTVGNAYKGIVNAVIWIGVVVLPILAPFVLAGWAFLWFVRRRFGRNTKVRKQPGQPED